MLMSSCTDRDVALAPLEEVPVIEPIVHYTRPDKNANERAAPEPYTVSAAIELP